MRSRGRGENRAAGGGDAPERVALVAHQPRAEPDDADHQFLALDELCFQRRPGTFTRVLKRAQAAARSHHDGCGERREREQEEPGHEAIEYIIGPRGTRAGRAWRTPGIWS
jgi:hypothetical protein